MTESLYLPQRSSLTMTNEEDPLNYYYHWLTGAAYKKRLQLAVRMLGDKRFDSLLEIGFGSGILLPELSRRTKTLYGLETHANIGAVRKMLQAEGVAAQLRHGSILNMDFPDGSFEAVVCLSVLEHMTENELPGAMAELARVTQPDGVVVLGFPVRNVMTDSFYRLVGFRPRDIHPSSHRDIIRESERHFASVTHEKWPVVLPRDLSLYVVCRCTK